MLLLQDKRLVVLHWERRDASKEQQNAKENYGVCNLSNKVNINGNDLLEKRRDKTIPHNPRTLLWRGASLQESKPKLEHRNAGAKPRALDHKC